MEKTLFPLSLQQKINVLKKKREGISLGTLSFESPLLLAPMSGITRSPYRLLMQALGSGGSVSELISCHGINHGNAATLRSLTIDPQEKNVGIQIFGSDALAMSLAARKAQEAGPSFIDINMGCPVRKVVTKGAGSALLRDTSTLAVLFRTIKRAITVPLTIKIRTGWDSRNASEVIAIAEAEGVEFVAVHGRTRAAGYRGEADWNYLEALSSHSPLPLVGNGDLHSVGAVRKRLAATSLPALMLGRGSLKNPFIFLESLGEDHTITFGPEDYIAVINAFNELLHRGATSHGNPLVTLKKHIVWFSHGMDDAGKFRQSIFSSTILEDVLSKAQDFFSSHGEHPFKHRPEVERSFMMGGHG